MCFIISQRVRRYSTGFNKREVGFEKLKYLQTCGARIFFLTNGFIFGCITKSEFAGSYGNSLFSILRNFHKIFHSGFSNLHSHQQCKKVPVILYTHQHLLFVVILMIAIKMNEVIYRCFDLHFT